MRRVDALLPLQTVDHEELLQVLLGFFGQAGRPSAAVFRFQRRDAPAHLDVKINKSGHIEAIEQSRGFPAADFDELQRQVRMQLLDNQDPTAAQSVLFATNRRVDGWFLCKDWFLIRPVPKDAPRPPHAIGEHPFMVQFSHRASSDAMVNRRRREAAIAPIERYLNLLLQTTISRGPRFLSWSYAWDLSNEREPVSRWTQLGYHLGNAPSGSLPLVPPPDTPSLQEITPQVYYTQEFLEPVHELALPANLGLSLDRMRRLSGTERGQLDRACTWLAQATSIWLASTSASYAALVFAIESLLEATTVPRCQTCGQEKFASTRRFKVCMRRYLPGIDSFPLELDQLYRVRSGIVHGKSMFEQDIEPWHLLPSILGDEQMELHRKTHRVVKIALYNWLWSDSRVLLAG